MKKEKNKAEADVEAGRGGREEDEDACCYFPLSERLVHMSGPESSAAEGPAGRRVSRRTWNCVFGAGERRRRKRGKRREWRGDKRSETQKPHEGRGETFNSTESREECGEEERQARVETKRKRKKKKKKKRRD
ncbi:unnamed protein product [Pleuronectes platessa]|uniref:Uncharacterized protein n=1 Tax=Pleuronectes platessa TaxID=8262 RepID=A0A9N7TXR6_PLEPL|nr:unnamed protein product [Pleuronectes platessa]